MPYLKVTFLIRYLSVTNETSQEDNRRGSFWELCHPDQLLSSSLSSNEGNFLDSVAALIHIVVRLKWSNIYQKTVLPLSIAMAVAFLLLFVPFADRADLRPFVFSDLDHSDATDLLRESLVVVCSK